MIARRIDTYLASLVLGAGYCSGESMQSMNRPQSIHPSVDESVTNCVPMLLPTKKFASLLRRDDFDPRGSCREKRHRGLQLHIV